MRKDFGGFHRYWNEWDSRLTGPIKRASGKLSFPQLQERRRDDGTAEFSLEHPICIYNAPFKASSSVRGAQLRNTIVVEGGFLLRHVEAGQPALINGHCSLTIFGMARLADRRLRLAQLDAMHFDMESHDAQTAYHPMFHVQRDTSNKLDDEAVQKVVGRLAGVDPASIEIDRTGGVGTQHLRLPTPQMDVFAVLTALIADFFSSPSDKENAKTQFKAILTHLASTSNLVREGLAAQTLNGRAQGNFTCPAHWYAEYA